MPRQPFNLDRTVRLVIAVVAIFGAVWLIHRLRDVLLPFCIATLIAYMFEPFVQFNRRLLHLKGRVAAIFVTLFEATFITGILCYFFVPMIVSEIKEMSHMVEVYATTELKVPYIPDQVHSFLRKNIDFNRLSDMMEGVDWTAAVEETLSAAWSLLSGSLSFIFAAVSWFIVLLYVIFIMIDYDRLSLLFRRMVPPRSRKTVFRIGGDIKRSMNHYFRGQALVAFLVGVLFSIGFLIIDMPLAVVMGLFIGVLNMVPYLQLISLVPAVLLCLVYSVGNSSPFWPMMGQCIAVYCIVQAIQDLILTPRIMGKAMGLNPALILLSLSVWGSLLGFIGLIIALPLTTLLLSYYNEYVIVRHEPPAERHDDTTLLNDITGENL